ncbi:bifunctional lysylphosphatidylglycerol flippase/synthetase MprF [Salana multivorans]
MGTPSPRSSVLLPPTTATAADERRQRLRVRLTASRVAVVLAVVAALQRHLWGHLGFMHELLPWLGAALVPARRHRAPARGTRAAARSRPGALARRDRAGAVSGAARLAAPVGPGGTGPARGRRWLVRERRAFTVHASRAAIRRALWVAAIAAVTLLAVAAVVALLARDLEHTRMDERLIAVVRAIEVLLVAGFLGSLGWTLLAPRRPPRLTRADHLRDRERARGVVAAYGGGTLDYFALRDDKDFFFAGSSVVSYSVRGGVCLVSPDPVGPVAERAEVWAEFLGYTQDFGWSLAVVAASQEWRPLSEASGLRSVYLGDEAVVDCSRFTLAGGTRRSLRHAVSRVSRAGYTTTFHDPARLEPELRDAVLAVSEESRRGESERGFSMTRSRLLDPVDTGLWMSITRNAQGRVDAFVQWVPARSWNGWSLDVMRRRVDAEGLPNGLIDFTIAETIAAVADGQAPGVEPGDGVRGLGLNFAVMRGVLEGESGSRVDALARPLLQRLSKGTQMETLATFNEKYGPTWVPRWVMLDAPEFIASQLLAVADAEGVTEIPVIGRFFDHAGPDARSRSGA